MQTVLLPSLMPSPDHPLSADFFLSWWTLRIVHSIFWIFEVFPSIKLLRFRNFLLGFLTHTSGPMELPGALEKTEWTLSATLLDTLLDLFKGMTKKRHMVTFVPWLSLLPKTGVSLLDTCDSITCGRSFLSPFGDYCKVTKRNRVGESTLWMFLFGKIKHTLENLVKCPSVILKMAIKQTPCNYIASLRSQILPALGSPSMHHSNIRSPPHE